jgi:hypothetical protein
MEHISRRGKTWTEEEELELLRAVRRKETHAMMATRHERTEGGIYSHLKRLACRYYFNENRSLEEIEKFTGLSQDIIQQTIGRNRREKQSLEQRRYSSPEITIEHPREVLKEIRDLLKETLNYLKQSRPHSVA